MFILGVVGLFCENLHSQVIGSKDSSLTNQVSSRT